MGKKYISAALTFFMVMALASPLFSVVNDTPCCQQVEMNCCMQQELDDCPMAVTSGETPIALLLISGPKAHNNQNVELTASQLGEATICDLRNEYLATSYILNSSVSPPTSFLTPLRI